MAESRPIISSLICLALLLTTAAAQEGCQSSGTSLSCTLLSSPSFTPLLPQADRDSVRWMTLYIGTPSTPHTANSQPISYPDWSQFPRLSYLIIYIHSTTPSPNYAPEDMFRSLGGPLTVLRLSSFSAVPLSVRSLETGQLGGLKSLRVEGFNTSGVDPAGLTGLESLELINTELDGDKETVSLDSVFRISEALTKLTKLSLENFDFVPLLSSPDQLGPLAGLESLTLKAADGNSATDVSVFFDNRIFPALKSLELSGFQFSQISDSPPPLTKLKLKSGTSRPFVLSSLSMSLQLLDLSNFNLGNLTSASLSGLTSLQLLYLSDSEDTIEVSDDTFLSSSLLTHLRISRMPNLARFSERAFIGLTGLTYLHLGYLDSLRTLDTNTSDLRKLESLYITSNRELSMVPVGFFRPLASLEMLNVRSNKFDEVCGCEHSYLSSLLLYSRPTPSLTLRSSCLENKQFDRCQKNHLDTLCWDFEGRCEEACLPKGNLSYACVCAGGKGRLGEGEGGNCVDLSGCIVTSNGVTSHNCYRDGFSCVRERNNTVSCSCYSQHAIRPDGLGCTSLSSCVRSGDSYLCEDLSMVCSVTSCQCLEGAAWNAFSKTCVGDTTSVPTIPTTSPPTTTTTTTIPTTTTTTTTTTIPTTSPPTTTTTIPTTSPPTTTTTTTTPTTTTTTTTPTTTTTTPTTTTTTTIPTTTTTIPTTTTTTTIPTTTTTTPTTSPPTTTITTPTTTTTTPTTSPPTTTITTPTTTTTTIPTTTTTITIPTTTTTTPTTTTTIRTTLPASTTELVETVTTTKSTVRIITTQEPTTTTMTSSSSTTEPEVTIGQSQSQPNIPYIVGFTLGAIFVGGLVLLLSTLLVVLLVKIFLYRNGANYQIVRNKSKPESLRSFESSNSSSSSKYKELSV